MATQINKRIDTAIEDMVCEWDVLDEKLELYERLRKIRTLASFPSASRFDHIAAMAQIAALAAPRETFVRIGDDITVTVRS